jgi:hypothetical protein
LWRAAFPSFTDHSLDGAGHGGEEVGRGHLIRADETQLFEVGTCLVSPTEINLSTFVQNDDFVEDLNGGH